jgi:hypothetical protein
VTSPNFLIIGAAKCGTTSLFKYLSKHPEIYMPPQKEMHYFDIHIKEKSIGWYESHFRNSKSRNLIYGEASPSYCIYPNSIENIYKYKPNIKLIMLLRNPVNRAISHYYMEVNRGRESLSILEAFEKEQERIANIDQFLLYSYFIRGKYCEQLDRIHKFFSKEQLLTVRLEDLKLNPQLEINKITNFLKVKEFKLDSYPAHFSGKYSKVPNNIKKILGEYYSPFDKLLHQKYNVTIKDWQNEYSSYL